MPDVALPELKITDPLTPDVPAFAVLKTKLPLLELVPSPVRIDTRPPLDADDSPADKTSRPPLPLFPLPTVTYIEPPRPVIAVPEPTYKAPEFPDVEEPELRTTRPLVPAVPEFGERSTRGPLLVDDPTPLAIDKRPPEEPEEAPADSTSSPPDTLPTAAPTVTYMAPPRPEVAEPVPKYNDPLFPKLALPELRMIVPLTPVVPALGVAIETVPLEVLEPIPLVMVIRPPAAVLERDDERTSSPSLPLVPEPTVR